MADSDARVAYMRNWRANNSDRARAYTRNRRAIFGNAEGVHTDADVARLRQQQRDRCAYCKRDLGGKGHVDHILPLSKGGSNWPDNIQLTCPSCNSRKATKRPEQFARELGLLV